MLLQMTTSQRVSELFTDINCQAAHNRCPLATPGGCGEDDVLGQRPYRCHVCRVGFKLKVNVTCVSLLARFPLPELTARVDG